MVAGSGRPGNVLEVGPAHEGREAPGSDGRRNAPDLFPLLGPFPGGKWCNWQAQKGAVDHCRSESDGQRGGNAKRHCPLRSPHFVYHNLPLGPTNEHRDEKGEKLIIKEVGKSFKFSKKKQGIHSSYSSQLLRHHLCCSHRWCTLKGKLHLFPLKKKLLRWHYTACTLYEMMDRYHHVVPSKL